MNQPLSQTDHASTLVAGAVLLPRDNAGLLVLTGEDRVDFLQRMTSNDIARLRPGNAAVTILTSPTARIVFVFTVLCRDDALWLLPAHAHESAEAPRAAAALGKHLRGQIFFMDKVRVQDVSAEWQRLRVVGAQAAQVLQASEIAVPEQDGEWRETSGMVALAQARLDLPGIELLLPTSAPEQIATTEQTVARLMAHGATYLASDADYTLRRIELGLPAVGRELTTDYNPLEAGMAWACANNKGCYTGQEIIARQQTYEKVTRTLVGMRSTQPLIEGETLRAEGRDAGRIISAAYSPTHQAWLGLAIVKRPWNEPETRLAASTANDEGVAQVVALPFES